MKSPKVDQLIKPVDKNDSSPRICFCHSVGRDTIQKAIEAGADTLEKIREQTRANTGCGGCQPDVEAILEEVLAGLVKK